MDHRTDDRASPVRSRRRDDAFSTQILDRALARKRAEREHLRQAVYARTIAALERLADDVAFERAILFGSVLATGRFRADSDVDIAFSRLDDTDFFPVVARLSRELERDVDIIQLENHPLATSVLEKGVVWRPKR